MTELGIVFVRVSTDFYNSERASWRICWHACKCLRILRTWQRGAQIFGITMCFSRVLPIYFCFYISCTDSMLSTRGCKRTRVLVFCLSRVLNLVKSARARGICQVFGWGTCVARSFVWPRYVTICFTADCQNLAKKPPNVWILVFHQWASVSNATQWERAQYSLKILRFYDLLSSRSQCCARHFGLIVMFQLIYLIWRSVWLVWFDEFWFGM